MSDEQHISQGEPRGQRTQLREQGERNSARLVHEDRLRCAVCGDPLSAGHPLEPDYYCKRCYGKARSNA